jgi:hypothetical protein
MKKLPELFVVLGVFFLIVAVSGRYIGCCYKIMGIRVISYIMMAQTTFLLAILAKLFEKK